MAFQGSINPMLKNFGEGSEASQYSGRAVSDTWACPFHAQQRDET
jgi:FPC/CPF motif-containing protein YcgG